MIIEKKYLVISSCQFTIKENKSTQPGKEVLKITEDLPPYEAETKTWYRKLIKLLK